MQFFQTFLDEQREIESEKREKDRKFFLQLSTNFVILMTNKLTLHN